MYTDAGRRMTAKIWDETLKELLFAKVEESLLLNMETIKPGLDSE